MERVAGAHPAAETLPDVSPWTRRGAMLLAVALVSLGVLSYGASASFTGAVTVAHGVDSTTMNLTVGAAGSADNRLTIAAELGPGTVAQRQVKLTIDDDGDAISAVTLTTTGDNGPPSFVSDTTNGLKLWIAGCSVQWTESGSSPDFTYDCTGGESDVLGTSAAPVPVLQADAALSNLDLADGAANHLRVQLTLPSSAPGAMQGQSSSITFTFDSTQQAGTDK